jgi:RNA polymerase sigma factor (TIGR02999 family)
MSENSLPDVSPDAFYGTVYAELKRIASHHLRTRDAKASLSTTDLVHEAYLKFRGGDIQGWQSRAHFFGSASKAMRQVLVDHARYRRAAKRGDGEPVLTLTGSDAALEVQLDELLVLDEALDRLRALDERLCRVVEMRFFAGLTDEEIAELLQVSTRTVGRDWLKARLYLARELGHD